MSFADKLIINVALTGMMPTKEHTPHVPITPTEIAQDVRRCRAAGAAIFHIHARDEQGAPTYQPRYFQAIFEEIEKACPGEDLILCVTTSGRIHNTFETRSQVLKLNAPRKPDMASLTLGSLNFPTQASVNAPAVIVALAEEMKRQSIAPELEVFEPGMIDYSAYLLRKGVLVRPLYYNILLGSLGASSAAPLTLAWMVNKLPADATWAATGIGRYQLQVNALAIAMGGHVRVGLEDEIFMDRASRELATNPRLVERIVGIARAMGREPATSREARRLIGLADLGRCGRVAA